MSREDLIQLAYIAAAFLFILGLRQLASPRKARQGNLLAAVGMTVAIAATLLDRRVLDYTWILAAAIVGGATGSSPWT